MKITFSPKKSIFSRFLSFLGVRKGRNYQFPTFFNQYLDPANEFRSARAELLDRI